MEDLLVLINEDGPSILLTGFLNGRKKGILNLTEYRNQLFNLDFISTEDHKFIIDMITPTIKLTYDYCRVILLIGTQNLINNGYIELPLKGKHNFGINNIETLKVRLSEIGFEFKEGKGALRIYHEITI